MTAAPQVTRRAAGAGETTHANRRWWDGQADAYQAEHGQFLGDVRFIWGPEGLDEADVRLLGDVAGRRVLEIGCGAGQCARWLATQDAHVVGMERSWARSLGYFARVAGSCSPLRTRSAGRSSTTRARAAWSPCTRTSTGGRTSNRTTTARRPTSNTTGPSATGSVASSAPACAWLTSSSQSGRWSTTEPGAAGAGCGAGSSRVPRSSSASNRKASRQNSGWIPPQPIPILILLVSPVPLPV